MKGEMGKKNVVSLNFSSNISNKINKLVFLDKKKKEVRMTQT